MSKVFKTTLVIVLLAVSLESCQTQITPIPLPGSKTTSSVSETIAQPALPNSGCPNKFFAQDLIGQWIYTSNRSANTVKYSGRLMFKADMSFEDPDTLFGHHLQNEAILAKLFETQGDTLYVYITDRLKRQQGVILVRQTSDCENLKFVGTGKEGSDNVKLTR